MLLQQIKSCITLNFFTCNSHKTEQLACLTRCFYSVDDKIPDFTNSHNIFSSSCNSLVAVLHSDFIQFLKKKTKHIKLRQCMHCSLIFCVAVQRYSLTIRFIDRCDIIVLYSPYIRWHSSTSINKIHLRVKKLVLIIFQKLSFWSPPARLFVCFSFNNGAAGSWPLFCLIGVVVCSL